MGSIRLLYATQTRVPHCSHSQLNDGVGGNGTSSTRGQASTSRNSKSGMYERYTRNLFGSCDKSRKVKIRSRLPAYHNREVSSRNAVGVALSPCGHLGGHRCAKRTLWARHQSRRHLQQAEIVPAAAGIRVSGRKHAERIIFE